MGMLKEFKEFAMRGNVVDMAVGIIIGASFGGIISSLVADVIMPPIGLVLGNVDFSNLFVTLKAGAKAAGPYASLADAKAARFIADFTDQWLDLRLVDENTPHSKLYPEFSPLLRALLDEELSVLALRRS